MKTQKILINSCRDPMRWYSDHIGKKFDLIPDPLQDKHKEWRTRDTNGYINFVQFYDGEIVEE